MNTEDKVNIAAVLGLITVGILTALVKLGILVALFVLLAKLAFGWFGGF